MSEHLTVYEALYNLVLIDNNLDAFETTAPKTVAALGGRDALLKASEMSCVGPIPRLDKDTWEKMSREYEDRRYDEADHRVRRYQ